MAEKQKNVDSGINEQHDISEQSYDIQRVLDVEFAQETKRPKKGFTQLGKMAFPHLQRPVLEKGTIRLPNRVWAVLESVTCDNETRDALILDAVKDYFWKAGWTIDSNLNFKFEAQGELFADQRQWSLISEQWSLISEQWSLISDR